MYKLSINDYEITNKGEIINKRNNKIVKSEINSKGYLRVRIGGKKYFVHRLVAEKYLKNKDNKPQVNHKDGNKLNNCVENLEWVTNLENRKHAVKNGLQIQGSKCPWAKLTEEQVLYIRNNPNISSRTLSEMYNVSLGAINDVRNFKSWKQLKSYAELSQISK